MTNTLFDPKFLYRFADFKAKKLPYSIALEALEARATTAVPSDELSIFSDVVRLEICAYEARGLMYGCLTIHDSKLGKRSLWKARKPVPIPSFVEDDSLSFSDCNARAVLLVDDERVFHLLAKQSIVKDLSIVLLTSSGIPRLGTRRLVRRLELEFDLPIIMLSDNDTWGYWSYSILKRGLMAPSMHSDHSAIKGLSFAGVRSSDWKTFKVPPERLRPWEKQWSLRLTHLRNQPCFKSKRWQQELDAFERNRVGLALRAFVEHLGVATFVSAYLKPRIDKYS